MSEPGSLVRALSGRPVARNFHSYVITEIGVGIASGDLAVGAILPNDAEMMDRYGVSRTVLREALKTLEAKGLVEARAKVGTRVLPRSRWNLYDRQVLGWIQEAGPDHAFLASFVEAREMVEFKAASLAAQHCSAEHVRLLMYWLNQRKMMTEMPEPFAMAEFEFHRTLCEASQNPFLRAASALVEFGVVQATQARLRSGIKDLAAGKAEDYAVLASAVTAGSVSDAHAAIERILTADKAAVVASHGV